MKKYYLIRDKKTGWFVKSFKLHKEVNILMALNIVMYADNAKNWKTCTRGSEVVCLLNRAEAIRDEWFEPSLYQNRFELIVARKEELGVL